MWDVDADKERDCEDPARTTPVKWYRLVLDCISCAFIFAPGGWVIATACGIPMWGGIVSGAVLGLLSPVLFRVVLGERWGRQVLDYVVWVTIHAAPGGWCASHWGMTVWGAVAGGAIGLISLAVGKGSWRNLVLSGIYLTAFFAALGWICAERQGVPFWWGVVGGVAFVWILITCVCIGSSYLATTAREWFDDREN